jgi:hypothetical protein
MKDEIKVTVIATGFDSQVQMMLPTNRSEHLNAVAGHFGPGFPNEPKHDENMDVPTFIRRQAD